MIFGLELGPVVRTWIIASMQLSLVDVVVYEEPGLTTLWSRIYWQLQYPGMYVSQASLIYLPNAISI